MTIDIHFGNSAVVTDEKEVRLVPDKGNTVIIALGINLVRIEYINGSWTILHNTNVCAEVRNPMEAGMTLDRASDAKDAPVATFTKAV